MHIQLTSQSEGGTYGAYEDVGVVVVGFQLVEEGPIESIMFQIAGPDFEVQDPHPEDYQVYIEINDQRFGRHGAVSDFAFDDTKNTICFQLDHPNFPDISSVQVKVPDDMSEQEILLVKKFAELASPKHGGTS